MRLVYWLVLVGGLVIGKQAIAQTIDYSIDYNNYECDENVNSNKCYNFDPGYLVGNTWWGSVEINAYGTCNTNYDEVHAYDGVAWMNCATTKSGQENGFVGYYTQYEDGYLVYLGYIRAQGIIWDYANGSSYVYYQEYREQDCDGSEPFLIKQSTTIC
jgi:hypothetical protein